MKQLTNLRFLLALGNQKVIVLKEQNAFQFYTDERTPRPQVSPSRIAEALTAK